MSMGVDIMVRVAVAFKSWAHRTMRCTLNACLASHRSILRSWNNVPKTLFQPSTSSQCGFSTSLGLVLAEVHTLSSILPSSLSFSLVPSFSLLLSSLGFALIVSQHVEGTSASANFETPSLRSSI